MFVNGGGDCSYGDVWGWAEGMGEKDDGGGERSPLLLLLVVGCWDGGGEESCARWNMACSSAEGEFERE